MNQQNEQYLLDSNVWIDFFKKKDDTAVELVLSLGNKGRLFISAVSLTELQFGWNEEQTLYLLPRLLAIAKVVDATGNTCIRAGELLRDYKRRGIILSPLDTIIAATALTHDMCMVTRNKKHFEPIKELRLYTELFI
jgi:predicted nucleic acid-binding protein